MTPAEQRPTPELVDRIRRLEDIEAIKQLKARWWFACDVRDIDGMRACYDDV